jgi:tetratricopeptide (TPR) repeat protein
VHISSRKFGLFGSFLFLLAVTLPSMAQTRIIQGKVTDDKGQPVAGAAISIQPLDSTARKYETKTDKKGQFVCIGIVAGEYRIVARAKGSSPTYKQPITPQVSEPAVVDLQLTPGSENTKLPFEMSAQEIEQEKKNLEKAEKKKQSSAEVQTLFDSGLKLAAQGNHEEAIAQFQKALEKDPEQSNIMGAMADSYSKLGRNAEAVEIFQKAIAIKPDDAALYTNLGVVLSKIPGKNAESQEAFKKAASLNPAASAQNFYNIGATLVNNGKNQEAADAFRQAIAVDANFAEAYYQLGMCLSGSTDTMPDAIKTLEKYIQIGKKPDQVEVARQIIAELQKALKK